MKNLFRPVVLFPDQYVDLSISLVIVFLVALNLFVLSFSPTLWVARGVAAVILLGTAIVGWEWFWHKRNNHQQFRPSYVYHNLTPVLLLIAMLGSDAVKAGVLVAFLFLRLPVFAALFPRKEALPLG